MSTTSRDPSDIFANLAGAEQLDHFERSAGAGAQTAFDGSINKNLDTSLFDPRTMVEVYLRPNRQFSQVVDPDALRGLAPDKYTIKALAEGGASVHYLAGVRYRVPFSVYLSNAAVLASPQEYAAIRHNESMPDHQRVQREIMAMRDYQAKIGQASTSPAQQEIIDRERARAREEDSAAERRENAIRGAVADRKAAELASERSKIDARLEGMSAQDFEQYLTGLREQAESVASRCGERGGREIMRVAEEEGVDLRARFERLQTQKALTRPPESVQVVDISEKIKGLRALMNQGALTQDEMDRIIARLMG